MTITRHNFPNKTVLNYSEPVQMFDYSDNTKKNVTELVFEEGEKGTTFIENSTKCFTAIMRTKYPSSIASSPKESADLCLYLAKKLCDII